MGAFFCLFLNAIALRIFKIHTYKCLTLTYKYVILYTEVKNQGETQMDYIPSAISEKDLNHLLLEKKMINLIKNALKTGNVNVIDCSKYKEPEE